MNSCNTDKFLATTIICSLSAWNVLVRALTGYFFYEKEMDGSCMEMVHADSSLSVKFLVSKGFFLTAFFFFSSKT